MRSGDFSIEIVPSGGGRVRETESGHVLARPGQTYRVRLRNHGPLRCVVQLEIDGQRVAAGGLALAPYSFTDLERPIDATEDGRFTVVAEGDEAAFGPDGGRDDPALGLIVARFRRELPREGRRAEPPPTRFPNVMPVPGARPLPGAPRWPDRFGDDLGAELEALLRRSPAELAADGIRVVELSLPDLPSPGPIEALHRTSGPAAPTTAPPATPTRRDAIERAAGTGLTGHSDQRFVPIHVGPLEEEATVLQLRIVIGTEEAIAAEPARPLGDRQAPARPAARP